MLDKIPTDLNAVQKAIEFGMLLSSRGQKTRARDKLYMDIANRVAQESVSRRAKVGAIIVKNDNWVSYGWNGMPAGMPNNCEIELPDGSLKTRPEVIHAEANAFLKLVRDGGQGVKGATLYCTWSPCPRCAGEIRSAGIARVVYQQEYRDTTGRELLESLGVEFTRLDENGERTPKAKRSSTLLETQEINLGEQQMSAVPQPSPDLMFVNSKGENTLTLDSSGILSGPSSKPVDWNLGQGVVNTAMTPEQHSRNIEQFRREVVTMDARPVSSANVTGLAEGQVFDYASAGILVELGMHHLNESLPNGQKRRSEEALKALEQGVQMMRAWMVAKGYNV